MASGVAVAESTKLLYQKVKMIKKGQVKLSYAVFKINGENTAIVPDEERECCSEGGCEQGQLTEAPQEFKDLINGMPKDDGRYFVYDYPYQGSFGPSSKVIMVMWCPEGLPVKKKMLYASSKDALKKALNDVGGEFQADCCEDLDHKDIEQKLRKC